MDATRRNELMWKWSFITVVGIAVFWTAWYVRNGEVPATTRILLAAHKSDPSQDTYLLNLPFGISRWWDILFGLCWSNLMILLLSWHKADEKYRDHVSEGPLGSIVMGLTAGLISGLSGLLFGLLFGLVLGLFKGLVVGQLNSLGFSLASCLIGGLSVGFTYGLCTDLATGLVAGLSVGLMAGLIASLTAGLVSGLGLMTRTIKPVFVSVGRWLIAK